MINDSFTIKLDNTLGYTIDFPDESHTYGENIIDDYETITVTESVPHFEFCSKHFQNASRKIKYTGLDAVGLHTMEMLNKS